MRSPSSTELFAMFHDVCAHFGETPTPDKMNNTGLLLNLAIRLDKNLYVSYSPKSKKWRCRIWEFNKIPANEKPNTYHGGFDVGYRQGLISSREDMIDDAEEIINILKCSVNKDNQ
jgi:hypothetical protein